MATNWDMYDTYNSQENNQEGRFGFVIPWVPEGFFSVAKLRLCSPGS